MTGREAAFRSLLRIEKESRYSNLETDLTLRKKELNEADARLYTRLVYGTLERKLTIDHLLAGCVLQPLDKLDREVLVLLRMSAYQILYADRIPDSAAVNEGVNLCRKYRAAAVPLVNAALRRFAREKNDPVFPDKEKDPVSYLSAFYSVSPDVCALFAGQMRFGECCAMLEAMNRTPATTLRVNTLRIDREAFCARLSARGVPFEKTRLSPFGVKVRCPVTELAEWEEGLCFVQDEASQLCVSALQAERGMTVLDVCACPGGKSFGTAMEMQDAGALRAFDLHENKLSLVRTGAQRLGITCLQTYAADARTFLPEWEEKADRILCDAPCSGLGVIAKKPEIRYKREEEMEKLPQIQSAILDNVCRYLKKGGRMVYSTCTVLRRENERVVEGFLKSHPDFEPAPLLLPDPFPKEEALRTLYPHKDGTDGFFFAALRRKDR